MGRKAEPEEARTWLQLPSAEEAAKAFTGEPHSVAECRWCGGKFRKLYGMQWACESVACLERCLKHAIPKLADFYVKGQSPILYLPLPLGVDMRESQMKRLLVAGAGGASKSYGGRWHLYSECRANPGLRCLLLRCTYDELHKNHLQFMPNEAAQLGDADYKGGNVRQMIFSQPDGNDSVIFCGFCADRADIPGHLGPSWDRILFEEGVTFLPEALQEISARDRGSPTAFRLPDVEQDGKTLILTNPGGRAMGYLRDFYIDKQPDPVEFPEYDSSEYGHIKANRRDNPYLKQNYAKSTLGGLSAARYKQLAEGDWSIVAGQFFPSFDPAVHVVDINPR